MKNMIIRAIFFALASLSITSHALDNDPSKVATASTAVSMININQADSKALSLLKGVGEKRAQAIVSYREAHGNFNALEDLLKVKGIGQHIIDANKTRLTL